MMNGNGNFLSYFSNQKYNEMNRICLKIEFEIQFDPILPIRFYFFSFSFINVFFFYIFHIVNSFFFIYAKKIDLTELNFLVFSTILR